MQFATYSKQVGELLRSGVFDYLHGHMRTGRLPRNIVEKIQDKYGRMNPVSRQAAQAIVDRYRAAREAGRILSQRRSDLPLSDAQHVGYVLEDSKYGYETVVYLFDRRKQKVKTVPVFVESDDRLSRTDVEERALAAVADLLRRKQVGSPPESHSDFSLSGPPAIVMAYGAARERA